jgi:hypothetical protein
MFRDFSRVAAQNHVAIEQSSSLANESYVTRMVDLLAGFCTGVWVLPGRIDAFAMGCAGRCMPRKLCEIAMGNTLSSIELPKVSAHSQNPREEVVIPLIPLFSVRLTENR